MRFNVFQMLLYSLRQRCSADRRPPSPAAWRAYILAEAHVALPGILGTVSEELVPTGIFKARLLALYDGHQQFKITGQGASSLTPYWLAESECGCRQPLTGHPLPNSRSAHTWHHAFTHRINVPPHHTGCGSLGNEMPMDGMPRHPRWPSRTWHAL